MSLIHAIYENGVFRPLKPVALPEACEVEFEPRVVQSAAMKDVYRVLEERYSSGEKDVAQRHNEHQP
jgi:predicted DNA-binding antitoxin AbrB/MazE fold protein